MCFCAVFFWLVSVCVVWEGGGDACSCNSSDSSLCWASKLQIWALLVIYLRLWLVELDFLFKINLISTTELFYVQTILKGCYTSSLMPDIILGSCTLRNHNVCFDTLHYALSLLHQTCCNNGGSFSFFLQLRS